MSLHVVEHDGGGPFVVFVHGSMDRATSFGRVTKLLRDLHTVAYDRHGYGHSLAHPPHTTLAAHAVDLLDVMAGRRGVVVGHSYGGDVALLAAIERPDIVAAVGAFEAPTPWAPWWPASSAGSAAMAAPSPADAAEAFMLRVVGERVWTRLPRTTRDARRAEGETLVAEMASIRFDAPFDPADVRVPVVCAYGTETEDRHRTSTTRLAEVVPDAELVAIEGATHGAHLSHPREFADFVRHTVARGGITS